MNTMLAENTAVELAGNDGAPPDDGSTNALIQRYRQLRKEHH